MSEEPIVCKNCGTSNVSDMLYCGKCGKSLGVAPERVTPTPAPAPQAKASGNNMGRVLVLIGGLLIIISMFLPWIEIVSIFGSVSRAGYSTDGIFAGVVGLLLFLGALTGKGKIGKRYSVASAILGLLVLMFGAYEVMNVSVALAEFAAKESASVSLGAGIFMTPLGGLLALAGGLQKV